LRLAAVTIALALASSTAWSQSTSGRQGTAQMQRDQIVPPQFAQTCSLCHGGDARGTDRAPALANNSDLRNMPDSSITEIIQKGRNNMPAFALPEAELEVLTNYIRSLNPNMPEVSSGGGDVKVGEQLFFVGAGCSFCHSVRGHGGTNGPDLSDVGKRLPATDLMKALNDPSARIAPGYVSVTVTLKDGGKLSGFVRAQGAHDLVLQMSDGKLHSLLEGEYKDMAEEKQSSMPVYHGTEQEQHDLVAFLSQLKAIEVGPLKQPQKAATKMEMDTITHPKAGEWPTYNGRLDGNRYSTLDQINLKNVRELKAEWTYTIPFFGLETTPIVMDGVMYVTGNNQIYALDGRTGREIWRYERPKSASATISSDAAIGMNRGVAVLGERVFYMTDDAHLLALSRLTGALLWDVSTSEVTARYGGTGAPLVVGDLVIIGVSGADDGIRGFIAGYKAATGELAWRTWTVPKPGEPGSETWKGTGTQVGGGGTWLTGSYDVESNVLYWSVGNPYPDTDGDQRMGSNLYTNSDLALDPQTGKILWHYQYTPHDLHDWDANQPIVLIDTKWKGQDRKLLLHGNRNGFLYVLDRTTGTPVLVTKMVDRLTWASEIDPNGWAPRLLPANETTTEGAKTCPAVRGATNWYSTAYNPSTRLYYVMTVEDCGMYRKAQNAGFGRFSDPADPPKKILRAFDIETGKVKWEIPFVGPLQMNYSGVLSTAGGLVFFGDNTGGFAAVDAATGKFVWHFEANRPIKSSPMTYMIGGKQYIAVASGANVLAFALPI
jgi:PQQ-dependent dehydrogenase (methanol/ethanol family)